MRSSLETSIDARVSSRMCSYIVVAVVVSIPPKMKSLTTTWAYLFHGYGVPVRPPKCSTMFGVRAKVRSPSSSRPFGTRYESGTVSRAPLFPLAAPFPLFPGAGILASDPPRLAVSSISSNSPATRVSK